MIPFKFRFFQDRFLQKWTEGIIPRGHIEIGLREASMEFLYRHGADITGSVLNCGSNYDRFNYRRFFPNCSGYQLLDLEAPKEWYGRERRDVIIADVQNMPQIPTNSEDCIIAYWLLYYLSDHKSALAEFKRVLKQNGILLATFIADTARNNTNILRRWTYNEACEMLKPFFIIEEAELYCETLEPPISLLATKQWERFIVDGGRRLLMTFIKASPI